LSQKEALQKSYEIWVPVLVDSLCNPAAAFNKGLVNNALLIVLQLYPHSLHTLLKTLITPLATSTAATSTSGSQSASGSGSGSGSASVSGSGSGSGSVSVYVVQSVLAVLKVSRKLKLLTAHDMHSSLKGTLYHVTCHVLMTGIEVGIDIEGMVRAAMSSEDEEVVVEGLELMCSAASLLEIPSLFELHMFQLFLQRNLKTTSSFFRAESGTYHS
jgi:hypothetical protein